MRPTIPLLTQTYGAAPVPTLATLEQGTVSTPPIVPSGYTDWTKLVSITTQKLSQETDPNNKQVLSSALAIAAAATPILGLGAVVGGVLSGLSLLGITIRGKTEHVDAPTSVARAVNFVATNIYPLWKALPTDARTRLWELTSQWDAQMWDMYRTWWGGRLTLDRVPLVIFPVEHYTGMSEAEMSYYLTGPEGFNVFAFYLAEAIHNMDMATVDDNIKAWYFKPLEATVLKPLDTYMLEKYNRSIRQYTPVVNEATGRVTTGPPPAQKAEMGSWAKIALVGGGLVVFGGLISSLTRKRRRV